MRPALFVAALVMVAGPASAEKGFRVSFEHVYTGYAVGTQDLQAIQVEGEFTSIGPIDIGLSFRKEGPGVAEGWGFGIHASHTFRAERRLSFVAQGGIKVLAPGIEYTTFRFAQRDNVVYWQEWDRISSNFRIPGAAGTAGNWSPQAGFFVEGDAGPFKLRGGIRATFHSYGNEITYRPPGGELHLFSNERFLRVIFAPTVAVGF